MKNKILNNLGVYWSKFVFTITSILFTIINLFNYTKVMAFATAKTSTDFMVKFNNLMIEYKAELTIFMSIIMLSSIAIFIYHLVKLNKDSSNPQLRQMDIANLLVTGVCLSAIGAISLILTLLYWVASV